MDWIKKNPALFSLALVALLLASSSALLIIKALGFSDTFADIQGNVVRKTNIKPVDTKFLADASEALTKPAAWAAISGSSSLFVSEKYIWKDEKLIPPGGPGSLPLHPPVPNEWFLDNNLDILSSSALTDDPDEDGFTNFEEWVGSGSVQEPKSTNPNDANSIPPYRVKLHLKEAIKKPFRIVFMSRPDDETVSINTLDLHQPSQLLHKDDMVKGTRYKLTKINIKEDQTQFGPKDTSEITLTNTETGEDLVLQVEKQIDSPDSYAKFQFDYRGSEEFVVKKNQKFTLKPEPKVEYKLIDINPSEALIQNLATGEKYKILKGTEGN